MRMLQVLLGKLLALAIFSAGIAGVVLWFYPDYRTEYVASLWAGLQPYGLLLSVILASAGLLVLLPLKKPNRKSVISFSGSHGEVTIQLESVEATLNRVVGKMPEVKKIHVHVTPSEDNRRAQVAADVWMYKTQGMAGAREIANRISDYLSDSAVSILGVDDVTNISLNVRGVIVDASKGGYQPPAIRSDKSDASDKSDTGEVAEPVKTVHFEQMPEPEPVAPARQEENDTE